MQFRYFVPDQRLRELIGSYYVFELGNIALTDRLRAEMANVRFLVRGSGRSIRSSYSIAYPQCALVGNATTASTIVVEGPGLVLGASVTAKGWHALFGLPADEVTDAIVDLEQLTGRDAADALDRMRESKGDAGIVAAADRYFLALSRRREATEPWLIDAVDRWLVQGPMLGLDWIRDQSDLSWRQATRLMGRYYGMSPKRLHRRYRTLHAALRIVSGQGRPIDLFYDQAHMIREFHEFVGSTPREYEREQATLIKMSVQQRLQVPDLPPLTLLS